MVTTVTWEWIHQLQDGGNSSSMMVESSEMREEEYSMSRINLIPKEEKFWFGMKLKTDLDKSGM